MSTPDYILEVSGLDPVEIDSDASSLNAPPRQTAGQTGRPWLSIHWKCCTTYGRIYRNFSKTAYVGSCPACGKQVRAAIGSGGTDQRTFIAR